MKVEHRTTIRVQSDAAIEIANAIDKAIGFGGKIPQTASITNFNNFAKPYVHITFAWTTDE